MSELKLKIMGEPNLIQKSEHIEEFNETIYHLVQELKNTMSEKGGVGIAAPQIGINKRIIVFGFDKNTRYPKEKPVPLTVLINPEYTILSDKVVFDWEGCLSVPGLRGLVPRYDKIQYSGYNDDGERMEKIVEGFHARIIQHEVDHLNGILFPFRIKDLKDFGFENVLFKKIHAIRKAHV